jgi:hypothetical protein
MLRKTLAPVLALTIGLMATAAFADGPASQTQLCGGQGDLWQQALELDRPAPQNGIARAQTCADPTRIQVAGGCCQGHGGPAGCDTATHRVLCADGKRSKSCSC